MKRKITGNRIFSESRGFIPQVLYIAGERIVTEEVYAQTEGEEIVTDAGDFYVIPGLIDLHFHGCAGYDTCDGDAEAFCAIAEYEAACGITAITPATMTVSEDNLQKIISAAVRYKKNPCEKGADLCGLYMEGPFLNVSRKGAQKAEHIRKPDLQMFERLQREADGLFRTVVVAPETEGALEFIRELKGKVNLSMGHMDADYDTARKAIACGITQVTHLYNAMPPLTHRAPGPIGAAADDDSCMVELICDGVHIHPSVVRNTFRMFSDDRILMISDSMRAAGMPEGESELGGQKVSVHGPYATLEDGTLAGSVTNLMDCVRTAVKEMGIPLESAVKCAAVNPARVLGIADQHGTLNLGCFADLVILDEGLACRQIFLRGTVL